MDRNHKYKGRHVERISQSIKSLKFEEEKTQCLPVRWDDQSETMFKTLVSDPGLIVEAA